MFLSNPKIFWNADNGGGDGGETPTDSGAAADAIDSEKFQQLQSAHDKANKRARELDKELKALRAELDEKSKKEATESGDVNKVRTEFQKDIDKRDAQIAELTGKLKNTVIESRFNAIATKYFTEDAVSKGVVWKLLQDQLDISEEESGTLVPVFKNSALKFEDALKQYANENPFLAKNAAISGSGARDAGGDSKKSNGVPTDFSSWTYAKKKEWMQDNPDLAVEAASKALG